MILATAAACRKLEKALPCFAMVTFTLVKLKVTVKY